MTIEEFTDVLSLLEGVFRQDITENQREAYWSLLKDLNFSDLMRAARELASCSNQLRLPTPGDLMGTHYRRKMYENRNNDTSEPPASKAFVKKWVEQMRSMLSKARTEE